MADLATRYGPNHPKMKELAAQRADIETKIQEEASRIAVSVRNEAETSRAHVASIEGTIRQIEGQNARKNQETVELTALQSAAASSRSLYQAFLMQYSQTENQQGILRPDAFVISASDVNEAFGPQTKLLAVLGAIPAGLLLGLALALMAERGAPASGRSSQPFSTDAGNAFAPQPAAVLPEAGAGAADLVVTNPQSPFAAATARLLSGILPRLVPPATIVVTAAASGSGRTTLALALARTAARSGIKTIVIDANRPSCHLARIIAADTRWPLAGFGGIEDLINRDPLSTALVMASHQNGDTPAAAPQVLNRLVANLKTSMELVVIAAPSLSDPMAQGVLALADAVLVAADARKTMPPITSPALTVMTHAR
jgi:Mrp family chromosome partitioning ATPase